MWGSHLTGMTRRAHLISVGRLFQNSFAIITLFDEEAVCESAGCCAAFTRSFLRSFA